MRKTKSIKFNGEELTVRELTVSQVKQVVEALEDFHPSFIDVVMDRAVPAMAVCKSAGLELDNLENSDIALSELENLYDEVLSVNPILAAMMERLRQLAMEATG